MIGIEAIEDGGATLAYVIDTAASSRSTSFFTSDDDTFQAGFVVYGAGGHVEAHLHLPLLREVVGTSELLWVRSGRCYVDIYSADRRLVATRELSTGDAVLSVGGGHGFRMIEDTVLFEIKQGPYRGLAEKERFATSADGQPL
jgi:hypothetical protein